MKTCAYCETENRDKAIFCQHCRRPLGTARTSSSNLLISLLVVFVLIGLSSYLFSPRAFLAPTAIHTPVSKEMTVVGPASTRTREPITPGKCAKDNTVRIRRGPGTQYETIGGLVPGTCLTILGRNEEASWVYIISDDGQTGWVDTSLFSDAGDLSRVSVRDASAMANPARPTLTTDELAYGAQAYLTKVAATSLPLSPITRYMVPCFEITKRIGENVACRMEKAYCDYLPTLEGSPTVCSDRPAPDQTIAVVALGEDWSDFDGQCLIVSGYLEIARGMLQIQALQRSQISVCE